MVNFFIGMFVGVGVAYLAHRAQALNRGGAVAAAVLGTVVFGLAGAGWAVVMLTFFVSSSLLSKLFRAGKAATGPDFAKGSNRDAWQVLANGGVSGAAALAYFVLQQVHPAGPLASILWVGFAASLAGANADTWATELGMLNPRQPLLLTTLQRVPRGTSGGVSLVGTRGWAGWLCPGGRNGCLGDWHGLGARAGCLTLESSGGDCCGWSAGLAGRFPAGSHLAGDLFLPGLSKRDGKAPSAHLWGKDRAPAWAGVVKQ
jgi:uncharacterized protein (TIGR00297 family)